MDHPYVSLHHLQQINKGVAIRSEASLSDPRHQLTTTRPSTDATERALTPEQRKHFTSLVEGIEFSRWFIVTYQGAVLGIVLLAAAYRWHERRSRRTAVTQAKEQDVKNYANIERGVDPRVNSKGTEIYAPEHGDGWASSSSSSTRQGDTTPPSKPEIKDEDDTISPLTPLLQPADGSKLSRRRPRFFRPYNYLRSLLIYQPPPLPVLHRIVPPNSTTLLILSLLAVNIFYLLFYIPLTTLSGIDIIADRAGLLFIANLPWLYLMAAKTQPIKRLTGDSYENLNLIHRRLGEWMCFLAVLHFGGMVAAWYNFLQNVISLWGFLTIWYIALGVGAFLAYETLYLTSLSSFREWWYEVFLASHVGLQVAALVLLWLHHFRARPYVGVALIIFVFDRLLWRFGMKSARVLANLDVMEDGETVKVSGNWPVKARTRRQHWLGHNILSGWLPSEHVFITIPSISSKHRLQFHPMTIASAAPSSGDSHAWFNLIIRAKAGFSLDLLKYARNHPSATIHLDGPYGSLHALEMLEAAESSIIVAGGSGIAVAYPMLWHLLHLDKTLRPKLIGLIWIVQDKRHISWLGDERLDELREVGCRVVVPPPSKQCGRPDVKALVRDMVDEGEEELKVGVVVSGPDGMNRDVRNTCSQLVWEGRNVEVMVEKFGW